MKILPIILVALLLQSCYSEKKAVFDTTKANEKYPKAIATLTRKWYPCIDRGTVSDSTDYKKWKNEADSLRGLYEIEKNKLPEIVHIQDTADCVTECNKKIDALNKSIWLKDDYIGKLQYKIDHPKAVHDTTKWEDSAKIKIMQSIIDDKDVEIRLGKIAESKLKADNDKLQGKITHKNKLLLWLLIYAVIVTGLHFIKLKIPFISK